MLISPVTARLCSPVCHVRECVDAGLSALEMSFVSAPSFVWNSTCLASCDACHCCASCNVAQAVMKVASGHAIHFVTIRQADINRECSVSYQARIVTPGS